MPKPDVRATAARDLNQVIHRHRSLDQVLAAASAKLEAGDVPLHRELVTGSVRHYYSLHGEVTDQLDRPLKERDGIILCLLLIGAYQLRHTRIPDHAAINETVGCVNAIARPWARGLVNGVLRAVQREVVQAKDPQAQYDHPHWLLEHLQADYPHHWKSIVAANNSRAPLAVRVNPARVTRDAYLKVLSERGIPAHAGQPQHCLVLETPVARDALPHYADGWVSIQDEGAQRAAPLLAPEPGERLLDACAAPGGKAIHLANLCPDIDLTAVDIDADRLATVRAEAERLGSSLKTVQGDATQRDWWDGRCFDRILIDAPCSGTGTLRRHPDIKLLKSANDLRAFAEIQSKLLTNLWTTLKRGGRLLYCTCSLLNAENDAVLADFLDSAPDARPQPIAAPWADSGSCLATNFGCQLLPSDGGPDGFYFALLEKRALPEKAE